MKHCGMTIDDEWAELSEEVTETYFNVLYQNSPTEKDNVNYQDRIDLNWTPYCYVNSRGSLFSELELQTAFHYS